MLRDALGLSGPYSEPHTSEEEAVATIWARVLELDRVGMDDDFFDLGGDSLIAENLAIETERAFGIKFQPSQLLEHGTPRKVASLVGGQTQRTRQLPSNVVSYKEGAPGDPIFFIHGAAGITFLRKPFLSELDQATPVYIFQAPGFDGKEKPLDSVEALAASYMRSMVDIRPSGKFSIVSFCAGAWIALEIARSFQMAGRMIEKVILVDPARPFATRARHDASMHPLARAGIPILSPIAASLIETASVNREKLKYLFRTGSFVNGHDRKAFERNPRYREQLIALARRQHDNRRKPLLSKSSVSSKGVEAGHYAESDRDRLAGIYSSETATLTSAMLKLAFRNHAPQPYDGDAVLLVNHGTARKLDDPANPMNVAIPRRRLIISGESHAEAVSSPKSAAIIRKVLAGAPD